MSLTNFISLLGTAGSGPVDVPRTHMLFTRSTGASIGTLQVGFFKIQQDGSLLFVGNDSPIDTSFENFAAVQRGYSPTYNQVVLWNRSGQFYGGTFTYRRHNIVYNMSDPDNPVRAIGGTQNIADTDGTVHPIFASEQVNSPLSSGGNAYFFGNQQWLSYTSKRVVYFGGNGGEGQLGQIQYGGTSVPGGIDGPVFYDEEDDLFIVYQGGPVYIVDRSTMTSQQRLYQNIYNHSLWIVGVDYERKLIFTESQYDDSANVNNANKRWLSVFDYSNYPSSVPRVGTAEVTSTIFGSQTPRVFVYDKDLQQVFVMGPTNTGASPQPQNAYYTMDCSDPANPSVLRQSRISYEINTRNFDYDQAQNTGYFFGEQASNSYVHRFVLNSNGIPSFTYNVPTDASSTQNPSDYLSSDTAYNQAMLYG